MRERVPSDSPNERSDRYYDESPQERHQNQTQHTPRSRSPRKGSPNEITDCLLHDADKLRVKLSAPKGMLPMKIDSHIRLLRNLDNDDDFFHVTCHIEPAIKEKIQRGDFVDLEKLLPKEKGGNNFAVQDQPAMELLTMGGRTFLAPPQLNRKINSLQKWDQAFRTYTMIYVQSNPDRVSEIWQYVDVIHTAANSYNWDNVATYDFTFHQLMATKPWRSWAKMYTQGWNLALRDQQNKLNGDFRQSYSGGSQKSANSNMPNRNWKEDCCWKYNRQGKCKKQDCKWDHRCTHCSGWNHNFQNCRKRNKCQDGDKSGKSSPGYKTK